MSFASPALLALAGLGLCRAAPMDPALLQHLEASAAAPLAREEPDPETLLLRGFSDGPWPGTPEQVAGAFLAARGEGLGLPAARVVPERSLTWHGRTRVHLRQTHDGVPVIGGQAVVTVDGDRRVVALTSRLRPEPGIAVVPAFAASEAGSRAAALLSAPLVADPVATLAVLPRAAGDRLVWRVELWSAPFGHWRVTLDARSGEVLGLTDLRRDAQGRVWEHNPDNSELVEVTLPEVEVGDSYLSTPLADVRTVVFDGDVQSTARLAVPDERGDFFYEPDDDTPVFDDPFAEVNAYWHIAAIRQWFAERWGHTWNGPASVLVNYRDQPGQTYDNAFWTLDFGGIYVIATGQGTVDLAYDADVLQHEFGHGIVEDLCAINAEIDYPWAFDEYGIHAAVHAVNEGMADYWSSTFQGDACSAEYFGSAFGLECLRDLDNDRRTPDDVVGEAHDDGEIVGGTCWAVREALGAEAADDVLYGALGALTSAPTFQEYAEAILEQVGVLVGEGTLSEEDLSAVDAILTERGWKKSGRAIALAEGQVEQGVFFGADSIMGPSDAICTLARNYQGGLYFPLTFQYSFTVPAEVEITGVDIDFGLTPHGFAAAPDEDDLQYAFYARRGELITFQEYNISQLIGYDFTVLDEVLDYDLMIDDQPTAVHLDANDPAMPLVPGETYYFDLAGMNCPVMDYAISLTFERPIVPPDDEEECGCGGRRGTWPGMGVLGLVGMAVVRRRVKER
jgi:Zn-dependent metalloprotease